MTRNDLNYLASRPHLVSPSVPFRPCGPDLPTPVLVCFLADDTDCKYRTMRRCSSVIKRGFWCDAPLLDAKRGTPVHDEFEIPPKRLSAYPSVVFCSALLS